MTWLLACLLAVPVALVMDWCWGEPPVWAHPVVAMGQYLGKLGPVLCRMPAAKAFWGGAMGWCLGAVSVAAMALSIEVFLLWGAAQLARPMWVSVLILGVVQGLLLKPLLAWRMLRDEVSGVDQALGHSLQQGRLQLQRLVSRDVTQLDESQVRESAIESLAENLNDSLVAPLFWFAIGGLSAAAVYRFANTADAMWGYRGRYEWAGKWAAHADDLLSWVPARLTSLCLCLAAAQAPGWLAMRAQARQTPSPNGGWPMGTMALLLGVRLRKPGVYALNQWGASPSSSHCRTALVLSGRVVAWAAWLCMLSLLLQVVIGGRG